MKKNLIAIFLLFSLCLLILSFYPFQRKDSFHPYNLTLHCENKIIHPNEYIQLVATITSTKESHIRLYEKRSQSFSLIVRSMIGDQPNFNDNQFLSSLKNTNNDERLEIININKENPFQLKIKGKVTLNKSNGAVFDFGEFGYFSKSNLGKFLIMGYWKPINPSSTDSLEDNTNKITVIVR